MTDHIFLSDSLRKLVTWASQNLKQSCAFPTETFQDPEVAGIRKAIRDIESLVGVPKREGSEDYFIRAIVSQGTFQRLAFPELALAKYEGVMQPCFIWHNCIILAKPLFTNSKTGNVINFEIKGNPEEPKKTLYALQITHPNNEETSEFRIRCWTNQANEKETYVAIKLKKSFEYLTSALVPYVFPLNWLPDGRYDVTEFSKRDNRTICVIDETRYYLSETHFKQLGENKANGRPTQIIIDGEREYTKEGNTYKFRNTYVNGFPPPTKFRDLIALVCSNYDVQGYNVNDKIDDKKKEKETATIKITEPKDGVFFKPALSFDVKGLLETNTSKGNPTGVLLVVSYGGKEYNIIPNAIIKKAYTTGMLDLETFEGVKLLVKSIDKYGDHLRFNGEFEIPNQSKRTMSAFNNLAGVLGLSFKDADALTEVTTLDNF